MSPEEGGWLAALIAGLVAFLAALRAKKNGD